jgi:hypothetical protein
MTTIIDLKYKFLATQKSYEPKHFEEGKHALFRMPDTVAAQGYPMPVQ